MPPRRLRSCRHVPTSTHQSPIRLAVSDDSDIDDFHPLPKRIRSTQSSSLPPPLPTSCSTSAILALAYEHAISRAAIALHSAKRVIVITGAGVSVSAGIPDFRSENGLYNLVQLQNSGVVRKGQDLFDASLFRTSDTRRVFYSFMAGLHDACDKATPTATHRMLRNLEVRGKLLRCYTQNIDSLEYRVGLGCPSDTVVPGERDTLPLSSSSSSSSLPSSSSSGLDLNDIQLNSSELSYCNELSYRSSPSLTTKSKIPSSTTTPQPIVVQLHGTLSQVRCVLCSRTFPFTSDYSCQFATGDPPECPKCRDEADRRAALGKRARVTGTLRPDVVLYNETHPMGDYIASLIAKDLRRKPDIILVMGTSLKVHGIKQLVRDLAAVIRPYNDNTSSTTTTAHKSTTNSSCTERHFHQHSSSLSLSSELLSDDENMSNHDDLKHSRLRSRVISSSTMAESINRLRTVPSSTTTTSSCKPRMILVNKTPLASKEWNDIFDITIHAEADEVVNRWMTEWNKLDKQVAAARNKREISKARRLAGGIEPGQARLIFPVIKNRDSFRTTRLTASLSSSLHKNININAGYCP